MYLVYLYYAVYLHFSQENSRYIFHWVTSHVSHLVLNIFTQPSIQMKNTRALSDRSCQKQFHFELDCVFFCWLRLEATCDKQKHVDYVNITLIVHKRCAVAVLFHSTIKYLLFLFHCAICHIITVQFFIDYTRCLHLYNFINRSIFLSRILNCFEMCIY